MNNETLLTTDFKDLKLYKRGKVRDVYDLGDKLLIISTDRISCFDVVLGCGIPYKGEVLTALSCFWFDLIHSRPQIRTLQGADEQLPLEYFAPGNRETLSPRSFIKGTVKHHLITADIKKYPAELKKYKSELIGRSMLVLKTKPLPVECVVRGYLSGSGWKEYQEKQSVCGIKLPPGLLESDKLPQILFTPSTKADVGHDTNINQDYVEKLVGVKVADQLKTISIDIYKKASEYAFGRGIIIADTKFEFGIYGNEIILIDEVLTPDSSRFWPKDQYKPGRPQASFDKQFVRDYLETLSWDKTPPAPKLPQEIIGKTSRKYLEAYNRLTEKKLKLE